MSHIAKLAKGEQRAFSQLTVKAAGEERRVIEGMATTPAPDRVGDIVEPLGAKIGTGVKLLWQHDHSQPVGEVKFGKPTKNGIPFTATFRKPKDDYPEKLRDRLEEAWVSVRDGLVDFVSIGFRTLSYEILESGGLRFTEWEMLELSLVTIPANSEATINTVKSLDRRLRADTKTTRVGVSKNLNSKGIAMATVSEKISAYEAEEQNLLSQLKKFDVEDMDEQEEERFDEVEADLAETRKKLKRLRTIEGVSSVEKAKPVSEKTTDKAPARAKPGIDTNVPKGIGFARAVRCLALAKGSEEVAAQIAEREYSNDRRIANLLRMDTKAAVPAAYTSDSSGWAETIAEAQTLTSEFIEFLRPMTVVDRMQNLRRVPFNVKVTRLATGQSGYWVGEAKPSPLTSGVFDTVTMGKTKVASISALTKEQMRFSNIAAETTIRDDLAAAVVARMDTTFVSTAAAVAGVSPAGLLNGLTAISANGSGAAADIRSDIQDLFEPFTAANISRNGMVLVMHENLHLALMLTYDNGFRAFPDITATGGSIMGIPVVPSNHVAAGDVIMIHAPSVMLADDGQVDVSMSDQASLEMLDGSLDQDATTGTGATTAGMVSAFQNDLVFIKIERFINWQKARSAAVAYIGDAGWNGVATA